MASSIRLRIATLTALIFAVILVAAAYLFVVQLQNSLYASVSASAERDAEAIADQTPAGEEWDDDDRFFQVADNGVIVAASEEVEGRQPITDDRVTLDGDEYLVFRESDEAETVIVGHVLGDANDAIGTVVSLLFVAVPVLIVIVFGLMLVVVGRALKPVERMRREVDSVTATNLDQRIVDPGSHDEIGRLATTMNRMLGRLAESQATQRRFISDASHELKSPLASLRQFAEVSRDYPGRISEAELAEAVLDESGRLERIVSNLLVLAHADEQSLSLASTAVDLDDLLLAEASRLRGSTELAIDSSGVGAVRVTGDNGLLAQVVRNLVDNAARHATSRMRISLVESSGGASFTVEDDGPGIPEADRERVFERFVRLDDARGRDAGGTGLGLAIVRELVVAHGGSVTIGVSPLGGAAMAVHLP
ncbi:HAMP domain-containing protein [Glaciihabitans arcticus]|uniref:histidine kinase n=1 Tax=Glaciihabitans arcticus TaxID=2668039 RepID=A0A4Q9GTJ2_9MICO|nr:ATP-binding protein [Glaciihabitans arcticus]TBN57995.1 HAMP domain-containing protein [Glaciihabitans arcticus]